MRPTARFLTKLSTCLVMVSLAVGGAEWDFPPNWNRLADEPIREGIDYTCVTFTVPEGDIPQLIHLLRIRPDSGWKLDLSPLPATPGVQKPLADQARSHGAIAALNGTFYDIQTFVSTCTLRVDGVTWVERKHPDEFREFGALALDVQGRPSLHPKWTDEWTNAEAFPDLMAAGPMVLHKGQAYDRNANPHDRMRHARTLIGLAADGTVWWAVVDAYRPEAYGMTYAEAGALMARLGCVDALNLDGGRSSGLWIDAPALERLKTDPRFARLQFSRPLPNAILLVPALERP